MSDKVITLPKHEEMLQRLMQVDDNSHLQERFYPILLKNAGEEKVAQGVVLMLQLAIHDYVEGMPPMIGGLLQMRFDDYIDALVDDEEIRKEAKDFFAQAQANA
ncbi:hypothetical protein IIA94_02315 [Patescibacteria group bacterium]|nr:hypothetical protein [Patescibacteria group bacterium]